MERLLDIRSVCLMSADNCVGWWGLEVLEVCMLIHLARNCCLTDTVICTLMLQGHASVRKGAMDQVG